MARRKREAWESEMSPRELAIASGALRPAERKPKVKAKGPFERGQKVWICLPAIAAKFYGRDIVGVVTDSGPCVSCVIEAEGKTEEEIAERLASGMMGSMIVNTVLKAVA